MSIRVHIQYNQLLTIHLNFSGFMRAGKPSEAMRIYFHFRFLSASSSYDKRPWAVFPSKELARGLCRGLGGSPFSIICGLEMLIDLMPASACGHSGPASNDKATDTPPSSDISSFSSCFGVENAADDLEELMCILLKSVGVLGQGVSVLNLLNFSCFGVMPSDWKTIIRSGEIAFTHLKCFDDIIRRDEEEQQPSYSCFRSLARHMVSMCSTEYVVSLLGAACTAYPTAADCVALLHAWCAQGYLPRVEGFVSIVEECLNSQWTKEEKGKPMQTQNAKSGLPFRSFVLDGVLKYIEVRRCFVANFLNGIVSCSSDFRIIMFCDDTVRGPRVCWTVAPAALNDLISVVRRGERETADDTSSTACEQQSLFRGHGGAMDHAMGHYLSSAVLSAPSAESTEMMNLSLLLFLQRLYTLFIAVKNKDNKLSLQYSLLSALTSITSSFDTLWCILCGCIRVMSKLGFEMDRAFLRFLCFLFEEFSSALGAIDRSQPSHAEHLENPNGAFVQLSDSHISLILAAVCDSELGLECFKSVDKYLHVSSNYSIRGGLASFCLSALQRGLDKSIKCVEFVKTYYLLEHLDRERFEESLITTFCFNANDDLNANWSALIQYIFLYSDKKPLQWVACKRLSVAISDHRERNLADYAARLLYKFCTSPQDVAELKFMLASFGFETEGDMREPRALHRAKTAPSSDCFALPLSDSFVIVVNDLTSLSIAEQILLYSYSAESSDISSSSSSRILGIDVEWKPLDRSASSNKCALLQIACRSHVFLFDLMHIECNDWLLSSPDDASCDGVRMECYIRFSALIQALFSDPEYLKIGA